MFSSLYHTATEQPGGQGHRLSWPGLVFDTCKRRQGHLAVEIGTWLLSKFGKERPPCAILTKISSSVSTGQGKYGPKKHYPLGIPVACWAAFTCPPQVCTVVFPDTCFRSLGCRLDQSLVCHVAFLTGSVV